ncbi:NAD(P)-dependent oxidoreductase [Pantoea rodasii]|uniref:NAD(P)-dependent oxidoreductase n=1 Tax=Pantoea rodasii TaxID=1076549 RepID=A0A2M9WIQ2_9GAMM|nr:NAD(P)-dependent oxidoreductase [Pantoea rodasii]ORM64286.1 phosphogluconate dehydrogenase [Pantoea rodasii]PJZ07424.1 NAD(P)-dependent oxidoreductase [Pantoea rodasii]
MTTIAIAAPGAMGAAVGAVLVQHGARVIAPLSQRSAPSQQRAQQANIVDCSAEALCEADIILSILPPESALSWAQQMAPFLQAAAHKPLYVDCNAISPETLKQVAQVIESTGTPFADAAIIGLPPGAHNPQGPRFWFAGPHAARLAQLSDLGLRVRVMSADNGAASALKMAYAGINKGITLLTSAMLINASRVGAAEALREEMQDSQQALLQRMAKATPDMLPKAWRWAAEMDEIATLNQGELATDQLYRALGEVCRQLADDQQQDQQFNSLLAAFFQPEADKAG